MKRAIRIHKWDFIAIVALVAIAFVVSAYIFSNQPSFTFGKSYYTVKAQFSSGAAITSGQGQAVDVAGVQVGQIGGISVSDGHALVTMNIFKQYAPIYRNATVLLRPRTPLKDMYLALDPGTASAGRMPAGGTLPVAATNPDVDFSEILAALDADTRNYLLLLLSSGAQAFHDHGSSAEAPSPAAVSALQGTFKRFSPLNRDTRTFTRLLATRRRDIQAAIHGLEEVTTSLGGVQGQITSLIGASNTNFAAISSQARQLQAALTLLPGTLRQSATTFSKLRAFASASGSALGKLVPFARALGPALQASRPLFRDTTPVIRNQLRPFVVAVQPVARALRPAAADLARGAPPLTRAFAVLNKLLNTLAYKGGGSQQSYLFWGSWLSHNAFQLANIQDANGPAVRGTLVATCSTLNLLETTIQAGSPSVGPILDLLGVPDWKTIKSPFCPPGGAR